METDTISKAPKILGTAKLLGCDLITKYGQRESEHIVRILVEHVTKKPYKWLLLHPDAVFSDEEFFVWKGDSERLLQGEPIQYVTEKAWFYGLELNVAPGVLIPRPETEELVEWALEHADNQSHIHVLDVGTGSGCIALAVAAARPSARVQGIDVSETALKIAEGNAQRLGLPVVFHICDVILAEATTFEGLDLLLSNPPYIPQTEYLTLEDHVLAHEPALALAVPDDDPLHFYQAIARLGRHWLKPSGWLLMEIHEDFGAEMLQLVAAAGYTNVELRKDMSGRDRMIAGQNPKAE